MASWSFSVGDALAYDPAAMFWEPKPRAEDTCCCLVSQPLTQSTVSIDCRPCKGAILDALRLVEFVMQQWRIGTPNLQTSDYHVRLTAKNIEKHIVNHKVLHKHKRSLLILWVPALLFLSSSKEQLWALVQAHSNFLSWLCACLSDFPGELLRKAEIINRNSWGCLPEVPSLHLSLHPAHSWHFNSWISQYLNIAGHRATSCSPRLGVCPQHYP